MECYTFTFGYASSTGQSSMTASPDPQMAFAVRDAQSSFNSAIKGLLKLIRDMPQLPRE